MFRIRTPSSLATGIKRGLVHEGAGVMDRTGGPLSMITLFLDATLAERND